MKISITTKIPKVTFMATVRAVLKNRWLNLLLKLLILVGVSWAFYNQTFGRENVDELWAAFVNQFSEGHSGWLVLAVILLPLTYQIEIWKWELAIVKIVQPTRFQILKSILAGTALSFWTPGQIGDYGGRLLFINTKKKWEVALATGVGNIAQQVAIITLGGFGVAYYLFLHSEITGYALWIIISLYLAIMTLNWLIYFNVEMLIPLLKKINLFNEKNEAALTTLSSFSIKELWQLVMHAAFKFLIYSFQYYCFLQFFGIYGSFTQLYLLILADYAIQMLLPVPPFLRLILRGEVAIAIWGAFSHNEIAILAASYSVFTLNVLLPSLFGVGLVMNANILKSFDYEEKTDL
jgi:hypothetical protein